VLVAHQLTGPQDRKALEAWIEANDVDNRRAEFMASLASLPKGTAWFWSPGLLAIFRKIAVRDRLTFDSSATPAAGARAVNMATAALAPVDLSALKDKLADTIEKAKADDPRELRKTIADLQRQLAVKNLPAGKNLTEEIREVPILTDADRELLAKQRTYLEQMAGKLGVFEEETIAKCEERVSKATAQLIADAKADIARRRDEFEDRLEKIGFRNVLDKIAAAAPPQPHRHTVTGERTALKGGDHGPRPSMRVSRPASSGTPGTGEGLSRAAERKVLAALSQYPEGRSVRQVAILTAYAKNGGGFRNALGALRKLGYIDGGADRLVITPAGRAAIGDVEPLPTGQALLRHWLQQLDRKAEREILTVLAEAYPDALTSDAIAERTETGYEAGGGGFRNALGKLRALELIEGRGEIRASADLFV
jgi:uncharacterized protein